MTTRPVLALLCSVGLAACGADEPARFVNDVGGSGRDAGTLLDVGLLTRPDIPTVDRGPVDVPQLPPLLDNVRVYAHTADALYVIDPRTFSVTRVGDFRWPTDGSNQMTDLAINAAGEAWGITFTSLYRVDLSNAQCTYVAPFSGSLFNGLSFVPGGELEAGEVLVAANRSGGVYRVDTATGGTRLIGSYGGALGSSGDIVSVASGGTFATVIDNDTGLDPVEYLARINPMTGRAVRIGPTGVSRTWGVGYWRSIVFGFTADGAVVTLDITTGRATEVARSSVAWWGAAVTTIAPVAPQ